MSITVVQTTFEQTNILPFPLSNTDFPLAPTTAGNTILVGFLASAVSPPDGGNPATFTVTGVTDDVGNTYTQVGGARATVNASVSPVGSAAMTDLWACFDCLAGATVATVAVSGAPDSGIILGQIFLMEVNGITGVLDVESASNSPTVNPALSPILDSPSGLYVALVACSGNVIGVNNEPPWGDLVTNGGGFAGDTGTMCYLVDTGSQQASVQVDNTVSTATCWSAVVFGVPLTKTCGKALTKVDTWELDNGQPDWSYSDSVPIAWYDSNLGQQKVGINRPSQNGSIGLLYIQLAATLTGAGIALAVPDDWTPYVLWGALSDLLSHDGQAFDPVRAKYCQTRYEEGVEMARLVLKGA